MTFSKRKKQNWIAAYIFIAPVMLGLFVFYIWPSMQNIWFSFNDVNKFNVTTFNGLENYRKLLNDKNVWMSFGNSFRYVLVTVPVGLFFSTVLAALLNADVRGKSFYRVIYFLPSITMSAAVALVWKWIYNEQMGILNGGLKALGLSGHNWLTDPNTALFAVMAVGMWMSVGYNMVILMAGMQGIPQTYYEAAEIDGASSAAKFFNITLPLLSPTLFFVSITGVIGGFQVFDVIYMMVSKTNPAYQATQTVVRHFYINAFEYGYRGYAAAISIAIFAVIMLVTLIQLIAQKKWVTYQ